MYFFTKEDYENINYNISIQSSYIYVYMYVFFYQTHELLNFLKNVIIEGSHK